MRWLPSVLAFVLVGLALLLAGCGPRSAAARRPAAQSTTPGLQVPVVLRPNYRLSIVAGDGQSGPAVQGPSVSAPLAPLVVLVTLDGKPVDDVTVQFRSSTTVVGLGDVVSGWGLFQVRNPAPGEAVTVAQPYFVGAFTVTARVRSDLGDSNEVTFHIAGT